MPIGDNGAVEGVHIVGDVLKRQVVGEARFTF